MKNAQMEKLIHMLEAELQRAREMPTLKTYPPYLEMMIGYFERVLSAKDEGRYLAAHCVFIPQEIFYAMDIVPFNLESYALFVNFFEDVREYLDIAAEFGLNPETCSAHRVIDAMVLKEAFPKPDFVVYSSQICDNTPKGGEAVAELCGVPDYFLDHPYKYTERSLSYYTEEIEGLVHFLEKQTKQKMNYDRLGDVVTQSQKLTELWLEISELKKAVPEPMPREGLFMEFALVWLVAGLPEATTLTEQLRDELKERVAKGIGAIPEERHRIYIPSYLPISDMDVIDWFEQEHGAVVVQFPSVAWRGDGKWLLDHAKPLECLARKSFVFPCAQQLHGPMEDYIEDAVRNAKNYSADGAIFFAHMGCRQLCGCIRAVKDELQGKLGIPMAVIDHDIVDKSFTSPEEMREKLDGFFELLDDQKGIL